MLTTFEEIAVELDVGGAELTEGIEHARILPVERDRSYLFDDSGVARVRPIAELHRDPGVNEVALPVVLRLLDRVYGLHRALGGLNAAIKTLPG